MKKKKETDFRVKSFKDGSDNWWVQYIHYSIIQGKLTVCAGGIETETHRDKITTYLKRKNIKFDI